MRLRPTRTAFGVSLALLVAFGCLTAFAQSGRRQAKPPAAAPVPTPTPEPTPTPTPKRDEDAVNFLVATGDRGTRFSAAPLTFHEAATLGCADQLRKRTALEVEVSRRELTRGEAIEKAKAGKTTYVVTVSVLEDTMSGRSDGRIEFEVDYVVFAPVTAKVMASGRTYENSIQKGPISVGRRGDATLPSYREQMLRKAGAEAAERILKSLHLSDPPPRTKD
jgi:hypothetical protein